MGEVREEAAGVIAGMAFVPARARLVGITVTLGAVVLAQLVATLIGAGRADAFLHRGHSFETALETTGTNKLADPAAVAVNETTGDVYVVDQGNNRIVRFGPHHEFLEAWGVGVGGGAAYEQCKGEAACKPGVAGLGGPAKPQFDEPPAIAVDNSSGSPSKGDIYVVANRTWKKAIVYKFDSEGKLIGSLISKEEKEERWPVVGIAVDQNGTVWIDREDEEEDFVIERFNDALKNQLIGEPEQVELPEVVSTRRPARPGFEVDSLGRVYITFEPGGRDIEEEEEELIEERNKERKEHKEKKVEEAIVAPCQRHECVVARFSPGSNGHIVNEEAEVANFDPETNTTGVASDRSSGAQSSGDVYLDQSNAVSAFTAGGTLIQEIGQTQLASGGSAGLTVDSATNEVFVADGAGRVDVYQPEPAGPPVVQPGSLTTTSVTAEAAQVQATIDPTGFDTHYYFRYGAERCSSGTAACPSTAPAPPGNDIGAGFGDQPATAELTGLSPDTEYHVVVVATSAPGGKPVEVLSEERVIKTPPASEAALPDGRAWELVSPSDKRGVAIEALSHEGGLIESAADGHSFAFVASAAVGEEEPQGNRAPELSQFVSTRQAAGNWSTHNITTPNAEAAGIRANTRREYQFFSEDLSLAAVFPPEPLAATQTSEPGSGLPIYLREPPCAGEHCYAPVPGSSAPAGHSSLDAATPDLRHIGINGGNGLFEWSAEEETPGEGHVRRVNILPNGEPASNSAGFGFEGIEAFQGSRNAIASDGSRVAWLEQLSEGVHLFQTQFNVGKVETIQVDEQNKEAGLAVPTVHPEPIYQDSSVKGDRLFFTDDQRLTANASFGTNKLGQHEELEENEAAGDLYVFERDKPEGKRLTDLTPDLKLGESSAVQAGIVGGSEDGSYVYFIANGVLAEGAVSGNCGRSSLPSAKCNLYEVHNNGAEWEKPRLIAKISNEDLPDTGEISSTRSEQYKVDEMTAKVSPNGQFLAFMSDQRLTGYNNLDVNSGQPDEEVFLFNAQSGQLVCASCNPTGARPIGVHDVQESGEGRGLLVDRLGIWSTETEETPNAHWLAASLPGWTNLDDRESFYQSRYLSNSGRLFFNSSDSLVKQDANKGVEDVYEYEPAGVGGCARENTTAGCVALISSGTSSHESTFLDASANGNDVFFLTAAQLTPADTDKAFDVYDARVCEGAAAEEGCPPTAEPPAARCAGEACRAPANPPNPQFPSLGSATTSSSGNVTEQQVLGTKQAQPAKPATKPPTRAQKLAAALKSCKRRYERSKKKRLTCERQARRRYAAKNASKSHPASKSGQRRR